ncbi:MAG: DEAD/DEAH box helicase family protein [Prevotella sp.]|nr:DEAD/DEAH box helicase family protein [Prevotella sp.]
MYNINDVLKEIRAKSLTQREKGYEFEKIMKRWFMTDPRYINLEKVWLWEEFPSKNDLGGTDLGIDLVAKTDMGDYWAIQCKCYAEDTNIDKDAVNSFLANASRTFVEDETFETKEFSNFVWVSTTRRRWGANAEKAIQNLSKPFNRINLFDLEASQVDWYKLVHGHKQGEDARLQRKTILPHQSEALKKAEEHYIKNHNERGKLIMACGTGKTYTSLKIMESITEKNSLVLFFVPSIALLSQTLNAWMADRTEAIRAICVCSDSKVTRQIKKEDDEEDESIVDLAYPASTNVKSIIRQINRAKDDGIRTVIMSTYQSIDVVSKAMKEAKVEADLCICDEAHRTTGVKISGRDESSFTKVHDNKNIPAKMRLYMTATPRLYRESVKVKAKENDDVLCSMDDEKIYGKEFHRLSFNEAVSIGRLTDYKVLVLTVSEDDIPKSIAENIKKKYTEAPKEQKLTELNFDDATKLIGCINGLSKRIRGDKGITKEQDPMIMRRAVAFCQTINPTATNPSASSTQMARNFKTICDDYKSNLGDEAKDVVNVEAKHIDGTMDANERNELITWLKAESDDKNECRILCNVRCLSEGVDVPALDAVLFLSPRNSEVEVVQSVGRVMRKFEGKKYGYIIIPVIVPDGVKPEDVLNQNDRFKVVWTILNALRSHDENFNAHVNQINLNNSRPPKLTVAGVPHGQYAMAANGDYPEDDDAVHVREKEIAEQLELRFGTLQNGIYAKIVEKVGDKLYWENWAKEIGVIAKKYIERIGKLVNENSEARKHFETFVKGLQENINPSIDNEQSIEMLAQHTITGPVFDALFKDYKFVNNNAVSRSMQNMMNVLESEGFEMDTEVLKKFYTSVKNNVGNIDNLEGKQTIIKNLYEKFFKGAFPLTVEKLGIVYTPVECVDFIIRSVDELLKREFNTSLTNENVHILDPFTGTGTFITRLMQLGVIKDEDLERKYLNEIHCNEIVLLAYYIADVNIESVYHEKMHPEEYLPYNGICLTDTFQLGEDTHNELFTEFFQDNSERVKKQKSIPVRVIMGNPPYSVGQKSANDNAQNLSYPRLENRIANTYAQQSNALNGKALYDTYIKAFRWATDRIPKDEGGIVAFISNGAWIDGNSHDGMRRCIEKEFTSIYILNLRGNQRTSGELSRREGGKIFGSGSRTPISITFLIKNPNKAGSKATIYYYEIEDYQSREQKLKRVKNFSSISLDKIEWRIIIPNDKADWINQRDGIFDNLIPIFPTKKKADEKSVFNNSSLGVITSRDLWNYNFSKVCLSNNINRTIDFYNEQRNFYPTALKQNSNLTVESYTKGNEDKISWTRSLRRKVVNNVELFFDNTSIFESTFRPYTKSFLYYGNGLVEYPCQWKNIIVENTVENKIICVTASGSNKPFCCIMTDRMSDYHLIGDTQCLPLYWYEENKNKQKTLFDFGSDKNYVRRDGISNWILKEVRQRYNAKNITKEHIFYYVYGLLHSQDYRKRFSADLKKSLPRIQIVESLDDFMDFYNCGKKLAALHLNYEDVEPCKDVIVSGLDNAPEGDCDAAYDYFRIPDKLRFKSKNDKSIIIYNGHIVLSNIPQKAYEYIVNGKSAIEWIVERYCVSVDKKSLIKNDCNDWARVHHKPRYVLDLLLSVINVSIQTVDIVNTLPKLKFD